MAGSIDVLECPCQTRLRLKVDETVGATILTLIADNLIASFVIAEEAKLSAGHDDNNTTFRPHRLDEKKA